MTFSHTPQEYHRAAALSTRRAVARCAVGAAVILLSLAACATARGAATGPAGKGESPGYDPERAATLAVSVPDRAVSADFGSGEGSELGSEVREAEVTLQCLLPTALSYPDTVRAPVGELHAFVESIVLVAAPSGPRPDLIAEVEAGRRVVANMAWWSPDRDDATAALQAAVDSGARAVVVPAAEEPWQIRPVELRGDLVLVLEAGAVLEAKEGAYLARNDVMFSTADSQSILIWGYGATLRMRKTAYSSAPYGESEYRHALRFRSVRDVGIYGVRVQDAGGDGIYIGRSRNGAPYSENVVIRDVRLERGNRQGLSVVSARRMLIAGSTFAATKGTLPQAGIDFEPNRPDERLEDIVVRDSLFVGNRGAGIQFFLWNMTAESVPISVRIESSTMRQNLLDFYVAPAGGNPSGRIVVSDSQIGWRRWVRTPGGLEIAYEDSLRDNPNR